MIVGLGLGVAFAWVGFFTMLAFVFCSPMRPASKMLAAQIVGGAFATVLGLISFAASWLITDDCFDCTRLYSTVLSNRWDYLLMALGGMAYAASFSYIWWRKGRTLTPSGKSAWQVFWARK